MFEHAAGYVRATVDQARVTAAGRGDRRIGTEHLLVAVLAEPAIANMVGVDPSAAVEAEQALDAAALTAIGLDISKYPATLHPPAGARMPLTAGAKDVLRGAVARAAGDGRRRIGSDHLLLAILDRRHPDPAVVLLTTLGVDVDTVRAQVTVAHSA